jgi:CheY-like chemotaxis protein
VSNEKPKDLDPKDRDLVQRIADELLPEKEILNPPRILVVDDDSGVRSSLRLNLEDHGFLTLEAANGVDAMEVLRRDRPALVVTDCEMPRMDGIELTHAIRRYDHLVPVIMVSGHTDSQYIREASGVDAYFTKGGFRMREMVSEMRRLITLRQCPVQTMDVNGQQVVVQTCPRKAKKK